MCALFLYSITHDDITMDKVIIRNIHCDVTMHNDIGMCTHHAITIYNGIAMIPFYYVLLLQIMFLLFAQ